MLRCLNCGIMQPFVRNKEDLLEVREVLDSNGCSDMKIYAKIENQAGVQSLETFMDVCYEVIIARGDLGNSKKKVSNPAIKK